MPRIPFIATVLLFSTITTSYAQSPAERITLSSWDDALARCQTLTAVNQLDTHPAPISTAMNDLHTVLLQLRRAAVTGDRQLQELALIRLDAVAAAHRHWAWPEYLLARTFYEMNDSGTVLKVSAGVVEGEEYFDAAMRHLDAALTIDPGMAVARSLALANLVPEGDRELHGPERSVVRMLLKRANPEADAFLVAGRDARTRMQYDSALGLFHRGLAAGGDLNRLALEEARTLQALGDSAGSARAYWHGVERLSPTGRESYRHDLAWILAPDSLAVFDAVPGDSVATWLRDFWTRRDAAAANEPGERLQEHFRRWNYAFAHFRVDRPWRLNEFRRVELQFEGFDPCVASDSELYDLLNREQPIHPGDPRHREPLLDHRGLIYIHHGAPYRVVYNPHTAPEPPGFALTNPPLPAAVAIFDDGKVPEPTGADGCIPDTVPVGATGPNESWLYWFGGSWRVMNFRGSCALGLLAPTTLTSYLPVNSSAKAWSARADLTPEYAAAAEDLLYPKQRAIRPSCWDHVLPMIRVSRADADVATRSDSDTPFVPHVWDAVLQAFALGAEVDHSGEALLTFAIPFDSLHPTHRPDGATSYVVATRVVGYDLRSGRTFTVDSTRTFAAPRNGAGALGHLSGIFEFALDGGDWQIAVRMRQPGDSIGAYALIAPVHIDGHASLMLSDLALGESNGLAWTAPDGAPFPIAVLGAWRQGGSAELYYEVRGVPAGAEYQSVISVTSDESTAKIPAIRLSSTELGGGAVSTVRKSLGLAQLKPGSYHLTVTVTRAGSMATRSRELLVVKP
jgi:hypothetical protein